MNLIYETPKYLVEKYLKAENKSQVLDEIETNRKAWTKDAILFLRPQANLPDSLDLMGLISLLDILKQEDEAQQLKQSAGLI